MAAAATPCIDMPGSRRATFAGCCDIAQDASGLRGATLAGASAKEYKQVSFGGTERYEMYVETATQPTPKRERMSGYEHPEKRFEMTQKEHVQMALDKAQKPSP